MKGKKPKQKQHSNNLNSFVGLYTFLDTLDLEEVLSLEKSNKDILAGSLVNIYISNRAIKEMIKVIAVLAVASMIIKNTKIRRDVL